MPAKHSEMQKRDAMHLLDIYDDINAVHLLTGIHHRMLRRWRKKLRRRQNATLSDIVRKKFFFVRTIRTMRYQLLIKYRFFAFFRRIDWIIEEDSYVSFLPL